MACPFHIIVLGNIQFHYKLMLIVFKMFNDLFLNAGYFSVVPECGFSCLVEVMASGS